MTEWTTIPACPSLMCVWFFVVVVVVVFLILVFFNRGYTEDTNSSREKMFAVCVCFLFICVRTDFAVWV